MRYIHTRDAYRPKSYTLKIFKEALGIEIYIVDREYNGRKSYEAIGWTGKQQIKPAINHYYKTPESRQAAIERTVRGTIEAYQRRRQRIIERNQPHDFQESVTSSPALGGTTRRTLSFSRWLRCRARSM